MDGAAAAGEEAEAVAEALEDLLDAEHASPDRGELEEGFPEWRLAGLPVEAAG